MRYADISRREQKCLDFTSLTVEEFEKLVPVFEEEFQEYMKTHCLDGKERVGRGYVTYANCPLPTAEDRLLFLLVYLKTNNLQVIHGELFKMSQGKANQWIHTLLPVMQATFRRLGEFSRVDRGLRWLGKGSESLVISEYAGPSRWVGPCS